MITLYLVLWVMFPGSVFAVGLSLSGLRPFIGCGCHRRGCSRIEDTFRALKLVCKLLKC